MSANNDSDDLEALFDSIAASTVAVPEQPKIVQAEPQASASASGDCDDLRLGPLCDLAGNGAKAGRCSLRR